MVATAWQPPADWLRIETIDAHTEGEPFRVVTAGVPALPGNTILARRRWARRHLDHVRRVLMLEPRGHADMYGCLVTPPVSPGADLGVLFLHNEGYSTMCGHGIIALGTVAVETGLVAATPPMTTLRIDTPAGLVTARVHHAANGQVARVAFRNVPSYVVAQGETVEVPGLGTVRYDLAFGGAYYAYVDAASVGVRCVPDDVATLIARGKAIKRAVMASRTIVHPFEEDLGFLYGAIFTGPAEGSPEHDGSEAHSRNVCIFADGEVDRSPTGTGVSGRLAIHQARGELAVGERIAIESILGTRFFGTVVETSRFGPHDAIVPEVEGRAFLTGRHSFVVDPRDPLRDGFLLR